MIINLLNYIYKIDFQFADFRLSDKIPHQYIYRQGIYSKNMSIEH